MATSSSSMAWRDPASLQKYGQEQYQLGSLSVALEAFNQALQLKLPDTVGILDNRAATYLKLGQLESALKDGRQMVKTDNADGRGYLRCGKVLQMMGKPEKALEIYTYGLRVLPSDLPSRRLILQLKDKLQKKMEGPKGVDPFTVLPPEIAGMVLEHFSYRQIIGILRVSRKWDSYLCSLPHIWTHLDLSSIAPRSSRPSPKQVSVRAMRRYAGRSRSRLTHATINNISRDYAQKALEYISRYPRLSYLNIQLQTPVGKLFEIIRPAVNLTTLIISPNNPISSRDFFKLVHNCRRLEHLEARAVLYRGNPEDSWPEDLPNLRKVFLSSDSPSVHSFSLPGIRDGTISDHVPNLEELDFSDCGTASIAAPNQQLKLSTLSNLRRLSLAKFHFGKFPELPSSLEQLILSTVYINTDHETMIPNPNSHQFTKLPNLKTFSVTFSRFPTLQFLKNMFKETEVRLTNLTLSSITELDGGDIYALIGTGYLESVEEFNISSSANITDNLAPAIIKHMPNLRVLNLNRSQITGLLVKDLVDAPSLGIEKLHVRDCGNLSADAIKYARGKGVEVVSVVRG